jgi:hypothetical protein
MIELDLVGDMVVLHHTDLYRDEEEWRTAFLAVGLVPEPFLILLPSPSHKDGEVVVFLDNDRWVDLSGPRDLAVSDDVIGFLMVYGNLREAAAATIGLVAEGSDAIVRRVAPLTKAEKVLWFLCESLRSRIRAAGISLSSSG